MCCPGCKAIAETIVASGLKDYYKHRTELPELTPAEFDDNDLTARESLTLYDSEALQRRFVARLGEDRNQAEATFIIDGISCAACAWGFSNGCCKEAGTQLWHVPYFLVTSLGKPARSLRRV